MDRALRKSLKLAEISAVSTRAGGAAVAVILAGDDLSLLLIRRAEDPRDPWSGHMALPGGRWETSDEGLLATALRETREEVGLDLAQVECLGELPEAQAQSRSASTKLWVKPYVFRLPGPLPPTTPNFEVAEIIWVPLAELSREETAASVQIQLAERTLTFPAWQVGSRKVWGLTYAIVSSLLKLANTPPAPRSQS